MLFSIYTWAWGIDSPCFLSVTHTQRVKLLVAGLDHLSSPIEEAMFTPFFLLAPSSLPPTDLYLIARWISPVKLTLALWKMAIHPPPLSPTPLPPAPKLSCQTTQWGIHFTMKPKYRRTCLGDRQPDYLSLMLVGP